MRAVTATTVDSRLAEDLVAEAFAKAWVSWREVREPPGPAGLGSANGAQHRRVVVASPAAGGGVARPRKPKPGQHRPRVYGQEIAGIVEQGDAMDAVLLSAVRRLPAREREVVALRVFLDLDTETTAKHLGIAAGTVRAHLSRAMAALRQDMAPALAMEVSKCTTTT